MTRLIKETLIFTMIALTAAFAVNYFSPAGIALVGQWGLSPGGISVKVENPPADDDLAIQTAAGAKRLFDGGQAVFVDARPGGSFTEGHIRGAVSLPISEFDTRIDDFLERYPPDTTVVTYCSGRDCMDSHDLAQLLLVHGYADISVYVGGYQEWQERGYPID
jgi:rhodanese-related sulfurtransferase